jgi:peptidyl-prolyl cis-trans isomerase D
MLQEMRKYTKSWIANIFLGLLTLSFVSWGAGSWMEAGSDTSVAKVGGRKVERDQFNRDFQNAMKAEGQKRGGTPLTADEARKIGLGDAVLQQAITDAALDNAVEKLGLTIGDATITQLVQRAQMFAGLTGQFDRQIFRRYAENMGYSEQGFIELLRKDLARNQLTRAVNAGFTLPPGYAKMLLSYLLEARAADFVVVDDKALGAIPAPPDATLEAYIKAHANQFSTPEYRDVTFAWLTTNDVIGQITVTDDQIKQAYEDHKTEFVIPEKRDVEQLLFDTEAAAKAAAAKAAKGTKFDDLTSEKGDKPTPQSALTADDLDAGAAKAVFALAKDGVSAPQKLASGKWALFKVTVITPGVNRTLDQAKEELRGKIAAELAVAKLSDISNAYSDAVAKSGNLIEAGKKVGMRTGHAPAIDAQGLGPDGKKVEAPDDAEFRASIFRAEPGEDSDPVSSKDGKLIYVVGVTGSTPPKLRPLAEVRERALAAWTAQERAIRLKKLVEDLTARANKEGSLDGVAKAVNAPIQKSPAMQQEFSDDNFSPALVASLFKIGPNQSAYGPKGKGDGYVVARITGIAHPTIPDKSPEFVAISRQLAARIAPSLTDSYVAQLRDDQKVTTNKKMIDSVTGTEAQ